MAKRDNRIRKTRVIKALKAMGITVVRKTVKLTEYKEDGVNVNVVKRLWILSDGRKFSSLAEIWDEVMPRARAPHAIELVKEPDAEVEETGETFQEDNPNITQTEVEKLEEPSDPNFYYDVLMKDDNVAA